MSKDVEKFLSIFNDSENTPKWVDRFQESLARTSKFPFLLMYRVVGIHKGASLDIRGNIGSLIAIATRQLQSEGYLVEGTQQLSITGDMKERSVLSKLGKKASEKYVSDYYNI